ncbi:diguanylate cyclase domain-containing protein [Marinospirillum alkaliphilum]|uniref:PAS domain S-box-containing protein/diguanylate cyclase (GGDEF) domain-containing protein n=1 Tax=Marinospirillum alkaliphilum DSM 21637 TaxID=1122209 RepID=A0A1K1XEH5_9GAMM|nr:diguanylate cyclase [Marinospirillum alkaliphilum]SFX48008.1 PAS domain S-box-containing protein/diguanylate cyclase (GGDEF) domain-containing protein [Marinospirillum alkaliphilum DSM 21637]
MQGHRFQLGFNYKLLLIYLSVVVASLLLVSHALYTLHRSLLDDRRDHVRHLVENNLTLLEHFHQLAVTGQISEEKARTNAKNAIRSLRYEKSGYFWINDLETRILVHPIFPGLEGELQLEYRDSHGQPIFQIFVQIARESGAGYVHYHWPKPGGIEPVEKLSYIELYEPWGWVIGSGIYLDDIQTIFRREAWGYAATLTFLLVMISGLVWSILRVDSRAFHSNKLMATALEACAEAIIITDRNTRIIWSNSAYERLTGYALKDIKGKTPSETTRSGKQSSAFYQQMWRRLNRGEHWTGELINRHRKGHLYYEQMTITPVLDKSGRTANYIAVKHDISDRKQAQLELEERASRDSLTGLPNRRTFMEHLSATLETREKHKGVMMMMDLDHFKSINDEHGHLCGDRVLMDFAELLQHNLLPGEQMGRLGGEEFALLSPGLTLREGLERGETICKLLQSHTIHHEGKTLQITVSIGLTSITPADTEPASVIDRADRALYEAKCAGRNCARTL